MLRVLSIDKYYKLMLGIYKVSYSFMILIRRAALYQLKIKR